MVSLRVLALPDFSKDFVIETNASKVRVGTVLMQEEQPLAYFSHKLSPHDQAKSVYERELMAMALAIKKWRPYLLGRKFVIRPTKGSLIYLLEQRLVEGEYHKRLMKLLGYNFDIQYKPRKENTAVDTLSRLPTKMILATIFVPWVLNFQELEKQVAADTYLANIITVIATDQAAYPHFTKVGTNFPYKGRVILSATSPLIPQLLREFHSSPMGGHGGVCRTYNRLFSEFYWRGIKKAVQNLVSNCAKCQQQKYALQPLPVPIKFGKTCPWIL